MASTDLSGNRIDLINGSVFKSMFRFSMPILLAGLFLELYGTVDAVIVAHTLGTTALAAVGACGALSELLIGFAVGVGGGFGIVAARYYGAGDYASLKRTVAGSLIIGGAISLTLALASRFFLRPLLIALNTPAEIVDEAHAYISTLTRFVTVSFAFNLFSALLQAVGNSAVPVVFLVVSSVLNIALDYFFIAALGLGIGGAALATVIAQAASGVLCGAYILRKCPMLVPDRTCFRPEKRLYIELTAQGLSMGFMSSIVSLGSLILQPGINALGYMVLAGYTAARRLFMFCLLPISAMSRAVNTFVSQNRGANRPARVRAAIRGAAWYDLALTLIITVPAHIFAVELVRLVSGSADALVLESGARYLRVVTPFFFALGMVDSTRYALQGLGQRLTPLFSSAIELAGKVAFALALIPRFGFTAVIFCENTIWCLMAAYLTWAFYRVPFIRDCRPVKRRRATGIYS